MKETAALGAVAAAAPPITSPGTLLGRRELSWAMAFRASVWGCPASSVRRARPRLPEESGNGLVASLVIYLCAGSVLLHRLDSAQRRLLTFVGLAGRDHLSISSDQIEVLFATRAFLQYELACHCFLLAQAAWHGHQGHRPMRVKSNCQPRFWRTGRAKPPDGGRGPQSSLPRPPSMPGSMPSFDSSWA